MIPHRTYVCTLLLCAAALCTTAMAQQRDSVQLRFATYLGGRTFEQAHDITCDRQGNVYVTGGTGYTVSRIVIVCGGAW